MNVGSLSLKYQRYFCKPISNTIRNMSIHGKDKSVRNVCQQDTLLENSLMSKEPFGQFKLWLDEAKSRTDIMLANPMTLATATRDGVPSARIVVCKEYDNNGFKFFTDLESRKSKEMLMNPNVAAIFHWPSLSRCVRIEGFVEKLSDAESTDTFYSQPILSQVAASVSRQSTPIESRDVLSEREAIMEKAFLIPVKKIPRPEYWGGFIIRPKAIEFYQGQRDHLHDRIKFRRPSAFDVPDGKLLHVGDYGWLYERLSP